jgi:hypothetical protein
VLTDIVRLCCALILTAFVVAVGALALDAHRRGLTRMRRIRLERPAPTLLAVRRSPRRHVRRVRGW